MFTFGNYPQGASGEIQALEWRVPAVEDSKALVISEKLLDCVYYNERDTSVTWETRKSCRGVSMMLGETRCCNSRRRFSRP